MPKRLDPVVLLKSPPEVPVLPPNRLPPKTEFYPLVVEAENLKPDPKSDELVVDPAPPKSEPPTVAPVETLPKRDGFFSVYSVDFSSCPFLLASSLFCPSDFASYSTLLAEEVKPPLKVNFP